MASRSRSRSAKKMEAPARPAAPSSAGGSAADACGMLWTHGPVLPCVSQTRTLHGEDLPLDGATLRPRQVKSYCTVFLLWFFFGIFGAHNFYLERPVGTCTKLGQYCSLAGYMAVAHACVRCVPAGWCLFSLNSVSFFSFPSCAEKTFPVLSAIVLVVFSVAWSINLYVSQFGLTYSSSLSIYSSTCVPFSAWASSFICCTKWHALLPIMLDRHA